MTQSENYVKTYDFLSFFPDVKPRLTVQYLQTALQLVNQASNDSCAKTGLKRATLKESLIPGGRGALYISPKGARSLIMLYKSGKLPRDLESAFNIPKPASTYAHSDKIVEQENRLDASLPEAAPDTMHTLIKGFENLSMSDLFKQLNREFIKAHGIFTGERASQFNGYKVLKTVVKQKSTTTKKPEHAITFSWIDSSGVDCSLSKVL